LLAVSETVYVPGVVYVWDGFSRVLHPPSPNDHAQTAGEFVEISVKFTVSGTAPTVIFAVNEAAGGEALFTVM
jgi:hypothetical protein